MSRGKAKNIYISERTSELLSQLAKQRGMSESKIIAMAIEEMATSPQDEETIRTAAQRILNILDGKSQKRIDQEDE